MKKQIDLEQQISAWEKKNEKTKTETVKNYQTQNNNTFVPHAQVTSNSATLSQGNSANSGN